MSINKDFVNKIRCWTKGGPGNTMFNWGDAISPTLYKFISNNDPELFVFKNPLKKLHFVICGSVMKWVNQQSIVWGTGCINSGMKPSSPPHSICAVRGPLTRKILIKLGINCPEVYGDPAILFSKFYKPNIEKKYELGIIPHYIDKKPPLLSKISNNKQIKIIDITQKGKNNPIFNFVDEVCECKRIISSSLHGIILAASYNIPAMWVKLSDKVVGKGFKFRDYFLSVNREFDKSIINELTCYEDIIKFIDNNPYEVNIDTDKLLQSCPFKQF